MFESAKSCALFRYVGWVEGIDFHHPAKAMRFVGLLLDVEAIMIGAPVVGLSRHAIALETRCVRVAVFELAPEITVEVLFRCQPCAPRRHAAGTVIHHADDLGAR